MRRRTRTRMWLAWGLRDARRRWLQVVAIALLLALGSGMYAAMSSMARWRIDSADASFAALRMHDLRLSLAEGAFVREGTLRGLVGDLPAGVEVSAAEERLVVPIQVDASTAGRRILVPGRVVGSAPSPSVDALAIPAGRGLRAGDAGRPVVVLEHNFARYYDLPAAGTLRTTGGREVRYVGQAEAPEYFIVTAPGADFGAESTFAALFTTTETAQSLANRPGRVNELVLRAPADALAELPAQLGLALSRAAPGVGATVTRGPDEPAPRMLYKDAENDQQLLDIFAYLLLGAAAFAAFNLVSRAVEAQRREIGIGMALGVPPAQLAVRPLLLGAQVALLGVLLGIPVGLAASAWLASVIETWFALPVNETPFEGDLFLRGALLGLALPLVATAVPVWRAVRVAPVEAIEVGARAARSSGLAWLAKGLRLPGGSLASMPVRNVLRTPRRTLLTLLGIAAVVTIVVAMSGLIDSFDRTLAAARSEATAGAAQRLTVDLAAPVPAGGAALAAIGRSPAVGETQPALRLPGTLSAGGTSFAAFVEVADPGGALWRPTVESGTFATAAPGLLIARRAADDLGVGIGDAVVLRHPVPTGRDTTALATTTLRVTGVHSSPFRFVTYVSPATAATLGIDGLVNRLSVVPAAGRSGDDVKSALLGVRGVIAVQHATATTDAVDERMAQFTDVLVVTLGIALAMALLMAYNAGAINEDERAREHATMFAYGVSTGTVLRLAVAESALIGVLATLVGTLGGLGLLHWIITSSMAETMPDIGTLFAIRADTIVSAVLAGIVVVALAPLLTRRRLVRTDIASTLRVVE